MRDRVYTQVGDGLGMVLGDGAAAGARESRFAGETGRMKVDLDLFERPDVWLEKAIEERFEAVVAFLGARSVSLD